MSVGAEMQFEAERVLAMFKALDSKQQRKAHREALNRGATILIGQTRRNLRKTVKRSKALEKGVRKSVLRNGQEAQVNIMGDFRLKFFEMSTKERYTKSHRAKDVGKRRKERSGKGGYRGRIEGKWFFKRAQQETEGRIFNNIDSYLSQAIQKIYNKQYAK